MLVCTRGRPHLLEDCLRSVLASTPSGCVVVLVEAGADRTPLGAVADDPRLHHVLAPQPGKSRQINQGLRATALEVVVLTDDDCRVQPGWVTAMVSPFDDPAVGIVFGPVAGLSSVRDAAAHPAPPGPAPEVTWQYANGAAMAVRRSAVVAVGGFDERLGPGAPLHGEEHDLVLRLQEAGWEVRVAAAPPVEHLAWRSPDEDRENLLVYSMGAGAFLGAALRLSPKRWARTVLRRCRYQASLWGHHEAEGLGFGPAASLAFLEGLVRGLALRPRRFLEDPGRELASVAGDSTIRAVPQRRSLASSWRILPGNLRASRRSRSRRSR
ncbi:MAG: glycosyltransferase [Actinobacteria bacterium]|nr:glycosyltransferase [Actinomycetota bacterium]